jgi:hypothetical protein
VAEEKATELDDLDGERPGEPFTVRLAGQVVTFRPAVGPGWRDLMEALAWPPAFVDLFGPEDAEQVEAVNALPVWQMRALLRAWRVHNGLCPVQADNLRLSSLLAKPAYRKAAERDLWEVGRLDLTVEWRSRRWRRLLNVLDGLRRTSHVHEAMALDDELAEMFLEQERRNETKTSKPKRRMAEYTVEAELLSYAVDRLGEVIVALAVSNGGKRRRVEPMPRPETALGRVRERRAKAKHKFTVARVFGRVDEHGQPTGRKPGTQPIPPPP